MSEITNDTRTAYGSVFMALRWLGVPADPRVLLALDNASAAASQIDGAHRGAIGHLIEAIAACHAQGRLSSPELVRAFRAASLLLSGHRTSAGPPSMPRP